MSEKVQYSAIVKAKVKNINDKEESDLYLLCRQYSDEKKVKIENEGLDIILDKGSFEDLVFLNDCEILEFEHIANVYSISELKEFCDKYNLTDISKCMKGKQLDCCGLLINEYLEPLGYEEELEDYEIEYNKTVSRQIRDEKKYQAKGEIIQGLSEEEIYEIIGGYLKSLLEEQDINTDIVDIQIIGSRHKGIAKDTSDLDVLIEFNNDRYGEDSLFNSLNDEENRLEINGIPVDFNPITPSKSGTIDEWLQRNYNYDKYKENMKEYARYIIDCLKEKFKDEISYVYKITFLRDEKNDRYTVSLAIDIDNNGNKNQINFISANKFYKMNHNEQVKYIGNFYNASIIGKRKEEFGYDEAKKDFLLMCDFNYTRDKEEEEL
ncbi:nucleotidyltransferase domain-containing protein [uncultured Clostridium sp.]|uniref:nucleotidyltransferase domain-containing protein n=1 Tax=uncultured Clostridium sp. TaxID=59620 RepID=UPI002729E35F|nr:nucleotidyltransferase domain-containing protein [uncultured Clostridium sp.]